MFSGSSEEARIDESLTAGNINFLSSPPPSPPSPPSQHQTGHSHSYQGEAGLSGQTLGTEKKTIQSFMMQSISSEILIPKNTV